MNAEQKRKAHKWACIIIFADMIMCSIGVVLNNLIYQNELIGNILHTCGILLETPLVIMFIKYMWDYHRLKKEDKKNE